MNRTASRLRQVTARAAQKAAAANPVTAVAVRAIRHRRLVAVAAIVGATAPLLFLVSVVILLAGNGVDPTCAAQPVVIFDRDLDRVLATIRTRESGGDYQARATGSSASGAYQFLDSTWAGYSGYPAAWLAPPAVQDTRAATWVTSILTSSGGDVTAVPPSWYVGHVPTVGSNEWDTIPAGNVFTPRQYTDQWLATYNAIATSPTPTPTSAGGPDPVTVTASCSGVIGAGSHAVPAGVDQLAATAISWGGYRNGEIPLEAMRYSTHSGYLHAAASAAWDQLHAAALTDRIDLDGWGYRPVSSEGAATAGRSIHGWGLAIDINVLVTGQRYATVDDAFASPEYQWLTANAARWGWINPAWAKPVALGGNGHGGYVGDSAGNLEPWHWEWAAFLTPTTTSALP